MSAAGISLRTSMAAAAALIAIAAVAPQANALEIKRMTLSNGAVLLVSEERQLPMVTLSIAFDAGSRRDPAGKAGLASLTAHCLAQGTRELSAADFNQKVDFMGSAVSVDAGRDWATAGFTSLTKYEAETLHLLAGIVTDPGLRDADIERKRTEQVAGIKAEEERPGYPATVKFTRSLFGDAPYGHPAEGYADSVAKLTDDDVRSFYRDHYKLGSAVIAVTGDVHADEIKALLEKQLSGMRGAVAAQPVPTSPSVAPGLHLNVIDRKVTQANIILGFGGIERSNPDYYRLQVMNYILGGGGFSSRLVKVVRSREGLAYSVGSGFSAGKFAGAFSVGLETKNASANQAIKLVLDQIREIQEKPVSDAELDGAKKYLIGSFPLSIDRQSGIASFMLNVELNGLGLDYADKFPKLIQAVTKEDVQKVARTYLHPDSVLIVAVANQREAGIGEAAIAQAGGGAPGAPAH